MLLGAYKDSVDLVLHDRDPAGTVTDLVKTNMQKLIVALVKKENLPVAYMLEVMDDNRVQLEWWSDQKERWVKVEISETHVDVFELHIIQRTSAERFGVADVAKIVASIANAVARLP